MTEGRSGALTPGRVFCSWRALWAFSADSLAQYVRKAHPTVSGKQETDRLIPPDNGFTITHKKKNKC